MFITVHGIRFLESPQRCAALIRTPVSTIALERVAADHAIGAVAVDAVDADRATLSPKRSMTTTSVEPRGA
jgi:hypothetical protein